MIRERDITASQQIVGIARQFIEIKCTVRLIALDIVMETWRSLAKVGEVGEVARASMKISKSAVTP